MDMQRENDNLRRENDELRQANILSTDVLDALRSDRRVLEILDLLKGRTALVSIADIANQSQLALSSLHSPSKASRCIKQETCDGSIYESVEVTSQVVDCWTKAPRNQLLVKHLLSLYWTWIHPAYPLFDIRALIQTLMAGTEDHSSTFLVAAICAAACDLLTPPWVNLLAQHSNVTMLQRSFITEANKQQALADEKAPSTLEALQVMNIVNLRLVAAEATSPSTYDLGGMDLNKQLLPEIEVEKIVRWLEAVDIPGS